MKAHQPSWRLASSCLLATVLMSGCGDDEGGMTSTTVTITAPNFVSPNGTLVDARPTLVVTNATVSNGSTPTYSFQVALDENFANIVTQVSGIAQGASQTSWTVEEDLRSRAYFWRARASAAGTDGPFSLLAKFTVREEGGSGGGGGREVLFDPLTDGTTRAIQRGGGRLTPRGWQVLTNRDFLRYEVHPIDAGYVEWQMTGLKPENNAANQYMILGMWDPTEGAYRDNAYRVHVQKLWPPTHNPPFMRLRWLSNGHVYEEGNNFLNWNPNETYQWRLQWGPVGEDSFFAYLYLDGRLMIEVEYFPGYRLTQHWIELGIAAREESIVDAVYSNLRIGEL